jgi:hypothetical protein
MRERGSGGEEEGEGGKERERERERIREREGERRLIGPVLLGSQELQSSQFPQELQSQGSQLPPRGGRVGHDYVQVFCDTMHRLAL